MKFLIRKASDMEGKVNPHPKATIKKWQKRISYFKNLPETETRKLLSGHISENQYILEVKDLTELLKLCSEFGGPLIVTSHTNMVKEEYYDAFTEHEIVDGAICVYDEDIES